MRMRRFLKDDDEWFDEHLNPANFSQEKLLGRMVILYYFDVNDANMFMVKDDEALSTIAHAPNGSMLDVADYLDSDPAFGLA
jgi:hypothetical protein